MPPISTFVNTHEGASASDNYYSTLLHELIHATGPSFRIGRECYLKYHVNKKERAKEELVAEIGSALWRQKLGFDSPSNLINTASYVKSWIALLEEDYNTIFEAATKASQAIEHLEQINTELNTKAA
jgi:antirestriction protein ArdC